MTSCIYFLVIFLSVCLTVFGQKFGLEQFNLVSYTQCRFDSDCVKISKNSFCFDNDADKIGNCKCRDGFDMVSRNRTFFACLGPAGYNEACEKNMQCQLILTENAECYNLACRCKDGAHLFTDGRCYVSVLLGDFCQSDGNCWMTGDNFGTCKFGRCSCKFDREVANEDKVSCVIGRDLGELCSNDAECTLTPNTQCRVSCRCAAGFVLSRNQTTCLSAATNFFDSCEETDQCSAFLTGSICTSNKCTCPEGFHGYSNRCIKSAAIGSSCSSTEECIPEAKYSDTVQCTGGTCKCVQGMISEMLGCNRGHNFAISLVGLIISIVFCRIL
ncbi:unnamed protein product [Psylliodes chrysocephalus]|uniref:EGF-like domain-containing protein n=1 Tax=Psylliodes chrysocephalus TaxID=3402493 RepID=A0A9P0GI13_9CUCU|nr:unnamed protein product [Psylliodes chrysocephala]